MPTDRNGNRADIICAPLSTVNRSNPARVFEQAISAAGRDVIRRVRKAFSLPELGVLEWDEVWKVITTHPEKVAKSQYEYIIDFYEIVSKKVNWVKACEIYKANDGRWMKDLCHIILDGNDPKGMYITTPSSSKRRMAKVMRVLDEGIYRPDITPVTYRTPAGILEETIAPVIIGSNYYLSLEKTATDGSGTSITKLGHHGTPTRLTNADKHMRPARETGTKTDGEAEIRNWAKSVGTQPIADMSDMYNDPRLLRLISRQVLTHKTPTNMDNVIDRDVHKLGGHRPASYADHMFLCSGKGLSRE